MLISGAVLALTAGRANAQGTGIPVFDGAGFMKLVAQLKNMGQQLQTAKQVLGNLTTSLNPLSMAQGLLSPGVQNPLPGAQQIIGAVNGSGNFGSLSGLANQFLNSNRYYKPQGNDFASQQMTQTSNSIAGLQAAAVAQQQSIDQHIQGLNEIQNSLQPGMSQADISAVQARLAAEQGFIQTAQVNAQTLQSQAQLQEAVQQERASEAGRQSADQLVNDTQALPGTGTPAGAATPAASAAPITFGG